MLQKPNHKLYFYILKLALCISLLGPSSVYAQGSFTDDSDDNLEQSLEDYRNDQRKLVEKLQRTHGQGGPSNGLLGVGSKGSLDVTKLKPVIKQLNGLYGRMSYESARSQILSNISQSPAKGMAKAFPKTVDFVTQLLRDNKALLYLLDMFKDKKRLTFFLIANIVTIILGFILSRMSSKDAPFSRRFFRWLFRKVFIYGIRIFILIFFFGTELSPTFNIFKNVFL